jgi:RimJ/RimL family protein N-acetyltransferase
MDIRIRSDLNQSDFEFLKNITNDIRVYQHIRDGKKWSDEKINKFINKSIDNQKLFPDIRTSFYYVIEICPSIDHNKITKIGLIGISRRDKKFSMTVLIDPLFQGNGYFSISLNLLKKRIRYCKPKLNHIFAQAHVNNNKMNSILSSKFQYVGRYNIGEIDVDEYLISLE